MIVTGILALTINKYFWTVFTAYWLFWAGPFTPATPLQIGLALLLKKIFSKKNKKNNDNIHDDSVSESADRERLNKQDKGK